MKICLSKEGYERVKMWESLTEYQRKFFIPDYIRTQQDLSDKNERLSANNERLSMLEKLSTYDDLTGLLNKRSFDKEGLRAMKEYERKVISDLSFFLRRY